MRAKLAAIALIALPASAFAWTTDPSPTTINANPSARSTAGAVSSARSASASVARSSQRLSNNVTINNATGGAGSSGVDPATLAALHGANGGDQQFRSRLPMLHPSTAPTPVQAQQRPLGRRSSCSACRLVAREWTASAR